MGLFDKLFVQGPEETVKGGERVVPEAPQQVQSYDEVDISGNAAEEILKKALEPLNAKETTVYTLQQLVSKLPTGTQRDSILGVLAVTKISVEDIRQDAEERINILHTVENQLQQKVTDDVAQFEAQIKDAEKLIAETRQKKADAESLLRAFTSLKSKTMDEINSILSTIN